MPTPVTEKCGHAHFKPHASDLIMKGAIAVRNSLRAKELARTIHPRPTPSEAVMEAAHGICGDMIHQVSRWKS